MCGVIGFYSKEPRLAHLEAVCRLFEQSQVRGRHAYGVSMWVPDRFHADGIRTFKAFDLDTLKKAIMDLRYSPPTALIGHTRYSTSGDYKDHTNNQPIHLGDGIALAFNGVISQAKKEEYEKTFNQRYVTDNDGEIVLRRFVASIRPDPRAGADSPARGDFETFIEKGKFSFAGAFLEKGKITFVRNARRPLWTAELLGGDFIASTRDIFDRSGSFRGVTEVPVGQAGTFGVVL